jgi:hypothetical protein
MRTFVTQSHASGEDAKMSGSPPAPALLPFSSKCGGRVSEISVVALDQPLEQDDQCVQARRLTVTARRCRQDQSEKLDASEKQDALDARHQPSRPHYQSVGKSQMEQKGRTRSELRRPETARRE